MARLTDTQLIILSAASQRDDRGVELPTNGKGEAARKAVEHTMSQKLNAAVAMIGIDMGKTTLHMVGLDSQTYVEVDQAYFRPAEVPDLRGDASKARSRLGWRPKISFHQMIREMLEHDLAAAGLNPGTHLREQAARAS